MIDAPQVRLPGVYFLPPPRAEGVDLPPMDVAGLVGFAERGPLHQPVAVEDFNDYRAVFGGDWPVAQEQGGQTVYAHLPSAVASFFANGGRRAYVVRVAGAQATTTRFRVPNLVSLDDAGNVKLATIQASSPGRWSEKLRLGSRLRSTPLPVVAFDVTGERQLRWRTGGAPQAVQRGDLLRLTFAANAHCGAQEQWLFPVNEVEVATPVKGQQAQAQLRAREVWQLWNGDALSPSPEVMAMQRLTPDGLESIGLLDMASLSMERNQITLRLSGEQARQVQRGDVLRIRLSDGATYLLPVTELRAAREMLSPPLSPPPLQVEVLAQMMLRLPGQTLPFVSPLAPLCRVERLRFDLLLWEGEQRRPTLEEMAFNRSHPLFWGELALLESSALPHSRATDTNNQRAAEAARLFRESQLETRREQAQRQSLELAALAGVLAPLAEEETALTFLPLGMPPVVTADDSRGPLADEVGRDDLDKFDPRVFQDDYLASNRSSGGAALMTAALDRYYTQNRRLHGLHSLMFIDEVALLAVPDAEQRGWPEPDEIFSPPEEEIVSPPVVSPPDAAEFHDCVTAMPPPPESPVSQPQPTPLHLPLQKTLDEFDLEDMLATQQAMLNFCEARADVVGILALPAHFEKRDCIEWQEALRQKLNLPPRRLAVELGDATREIADLSYVAVYHPWLLVADAAAPERLRSVPPEGAVCGMIAARERTRQVWVAAANVPLQGLRGLTPRLSTDDWADLFERQFNLLRQEPRDFRAMSAHTLSDESIWLQLSVRRLMILLRKVALQRGFDLVFEGNNERFREGVRLALETMLRRMFDRGAFAGASPAQAFRVTTDASVNPPQSVEQGRFIAQIQVAPSQPMEFITVLLTRAGDDLLQAIEA